MSGVRLIIIVLVAECITGCANNLRSVAGKYANARTGDTLVLGIKDEYEFKQKLLSGEFGWNTGRYELTDKQVKFYDTKPLALVGVKIQVTPGMDIAEPWQFTLQVKGSKISTPIDSIAAYIGQSPASQQDFIFKAQRLTIFNQGVDSVIMHSRFFPPISFRLTRFKPYHLYILSISPLERLYELDKYSYRARMRSLTAIKRDFHFRKIQ